MLKKIRHLSEGHFYGLHVTNKAKALSLDKEIRNIDSVRQAQTHIYRKEERDLLGTLEKLHRKKDDHHLYEPHVVSSSQRRKSWPHEALVSARLSQQKVFLDSVKSNRPSAGSIVIPAPTVGSTVSLGNGDDHIPAVPLTGAKHMTGIAIHRTTGYTNCCVVCNLPRHAHGSGHPPEAVCRCHHGAQAQLKDSEDNYHQPGAHVHAHMHHPEDDFFQPEDAPLQPDVHHESHTHAHATEHSPHRPQKRQLSITDVDLVTAEFKRGKQSTFHRDHEKSLIHRVHNEFTRLNEMSKAPNAIKSDHKQLADTKRYLAEHHKQSNSVRSRGNSIEEELKHNRKPTKQAIDEYLGHRSRRGSLEEQSSWLRYGYGYGDKSRRSSFDYSDYYPGGSTQSSRRGSIEESSHYQALRSAYNKYSEMVTRHGHLPGTNGRRASSSGDHLPELSHKDQEDKQVFQGLLHPDNIINHHHFLPYEAMKSQKHGQHRKHSHLDNRNHDYRYHDYRNHGHERRERTRTGSFGREQRGSFGHVAALFDRAHENEASNVNHSRDMLMKLRQLLHVYHEMESEQNRYPWPRPSVQEFTAEDYEKLKSCRYLRIPKSQQNLSEMDKDILDDHAKQYIANLLQR